MPQSVIHRDGAVSPSDQLTQKLVPFHVPLGTTSIHVKYSYTGREAGNGVDLGLLGVDGQFRGYSGGARFEIFVANDAATPGYIPGLLAPGTWHVMLGVYQVKVPASYSIDITLNDVPRPEFESRPAPSRADYSASLRRLPGQRPRYTWLKGDFHVHTVYSDGKLSMDEMVKKALARGLDFIFSTEHNTNSANISWGPHVPPGFLVGRGIEVTTYEGHWNAIGLLPQQMIDPVIHDKSDKDASLVAAVEQVHHSDGLAIINHPYAECKCCDWTFSFHDHMDAIEVWNGPWKRHEKDESNIKAVAKWDALLREGRVFTASGGSDVHEAQFEVAEPTTRVFADEVSVNAIIRGLRNRQVYVAQHPTYEVDFTLSHGGRRAGIGDWIELDSGDCDDGDVVAKIALRGPLPECKVRVITESGIVYESSERNLRVPVKGHYVRVEVRDGQDDMLALTNPIWVFPAR